MVFSILGYRARPLSGDGGRVALVAGRPARRGPAGGNRHYGGCAGAVAAADTGAAEAHRPPRGRWRSRFHAGCPACTPWRGRFGNFAPT